MTNPPHALEKKALSAPPMLIVSALHDPFTLVVWAEGIHGELPKSVLLLRNGSGHTSYGFGGDTRAAEDAFFLTGKLPAPGTVLDS